MRLEHQADWLAAQLHGRRGATDWHNALKLGFDPQAGAYPPWLVQQVRRTSPAGPDHLSNSWRAGAPPNSFCAEWACVLKWVRWRLMEIVCISGEVSGLMAT